MASRQHQAQCQAAPTCRHARQFEHLLTPLPRLPYHSKRVNYPDGAKRKKVGWFQIIFRSILPERPSAYRQCMRSHTGPDQPEIQFPAKAPQNGKYLSMTARRLRFLSQMRQALAIPQPEREVQNNRCHQRAQWRKFFA